MSQDKAFDDYLAGDSEVSEAYEALPASEPPPSLDSAILRRAHHAAKHGPRLTSSPFTTHWALPLGLAAALVVTVGLFFQLQRYAPPEGLGSPTDLLVPEDKAAPTPTMRPVP